MQSYKSPPSSVLKVLQCLRVALSDPTDLPAPVDLDWAALRKYMHNTRQLLSDIMLLGPREARHPLKAAAMEPFFNDPEFSVRSVSQVSGAAGHVCGWIHGLMSKKVQPVRDVVYGERSRGNISGTELLQALIRDVKTLKKDLGERWRRYEEEREDERLDLEKDHLETEWRSVVPPASMVRHECARRSCASLVYPTGQLHCGRCAVLRRCSILGTPCALWRRT